MILGAVLLGLFSSLHCIAMCGPIAMMLPLDRTSVYKKNFQIILYQLGRIITYSTLGLLFGVFGKGLFLAGAQQNLSVILGLLMIVFVLISDKTISNYNFSKPITKILQKLKYELGQQFQKKGNKAIFLIGILNGFLPCALVYVALFGAIATQNIQQSILYMFSYGLGTIPLMFLVVLFSNKIKYFSKFNFQKLIPIFTIVLGILFIIRGLGLSIPYISPSLLNLLIGANIHCT